MSRFLEDLRKHYRNGDSKIILAQMLRIRYTLTQDAKMGRPSSEIPMRDVPNSILERVIQTLQDDGLTAVRTNEGIKVSGWAP
jgi:hypothetical protein